MRIALMAINVRGGPAPATDSQIAPAVHTARVQPDANARKPLQELTGINAVEAAWPYPLNVKIFETVKFGSHHEHKHRIRPAGSIRRPAIG
jgi:hypothetical protein